MKIIIVVVGIVVFLSGLTFFLQGINVLPGSYMTGDPQWTINGSIMMAISVGLFWFALKR